MSKVAIHTKDYNSDGLHSTSTTCEALVLPVRNIDITVDNGRIYVSLNGTQVYENTSLHSGNVEITL